MLTWFFFFFLNNSLRHLKWRIPSSLQKYLSNACCVPGSGQGPGDSSTWCALSPACSLRPVPRASGAARWDREEMSNCRALWRGQLERGQSRPLMGNDTVLRPDRWGGISQGAVPCEGLSTTSCEISVLLELRAEAELEKWTGAGSPRPLCAMLRSSDFILKVCSVMQTQVCEGSNFVINVCVFVCVCKNECALNWCL